MNIRALLVVSGLLTAFSAAAQTEVVYSIQIVHGLNAIVNQVNAGSNHLSDIFNNLPNQTVIYRFSSSTGTFGQGAIFTAGQGWFDRDNPLGNGGPITGPVLLPGTGAFLLNPSGPYTLTVTGMVNFPKPSGIACATYNLLGRGKIGIGTYENIIGTTPQDGSQVLIYTPDGTTNLPNASSSTLTAHTFIGGGWLPSPPNLNIGQSAFFHNSCFGTCFTVQSSNILVTSPTITQVSFTPTFSDLCVAGVPPSVTFFSRPPSGSFFTPGTTPVHTVALDAFGNAASCDFTVTVAPPPITPPTQSYTLNIHAGLNLIAYQFLNGGNTLREITTNVPDGTVVSKYDNAAAKWIQSTYSSALGAWVPPNITLRPGEGAFLNSISNANNPGNFSLLLSGHPNLPVLPVPITNGIALLSRQTNGVGTYLNITGTNPVAGTKVFKWNGTGYDQYTFNGAIWSPFEPNNAVGEAWWISPAGTLPPVIPQAPLITQQPVSLQVSSNVTAGFSVVATGDLPLHYQWRLNGNPINGATNNTFVFLSVKSTNSGNYDVLVQNLIGITASTIASLVVTNVPTLPFSDNFANAGNLPTPSGGTGIGSNVGASVESGESGPGFIPGGASVWVRWHSPLTGVATFSTAGSSFDTLLGVYTGNAITSAVPVVFDDDSGGSLCSSISFNSIRGGVYDIQIDGFYGSTGNIALTWSFISTSEQLPVIVTPPHNSTVANGLRSSFSVTVTSNAPIGYQWFKDGAPISGATNSAFLVTRVTASQVGVYQVMVSNITGQHFSVLSFPAELQINSAGPGQPIVDGARAESKIEAVLDTTDRPNDPYDPPIVTGYSGSQIYTTDGAVEEPAEPLHCGVTCYFTKWHDYMAPVSGLLSVANSGTTFPGVLGIYTTDNFSLVPLGCSGGHGAGQEAVVFQATAGTIYSIAMSGTNTGAGGTVQLQYQTLAPPIYTTLPVSQTYDSNAPVTLTVLATGNPNPGYQWQLNGTNIPGATGTTYTIPKFGTNDQGNYAVIATNTAGTNIFEFAPAYIDNPPQFANTANMGGVLFTQLMGMANSNYLFESSTDLVHWTINSSSSSASGIMNLMVPIQSKSNSVTFRGVLPAPIP